jgi:hypothetical protein
MRGQSGTLEGLKYQYQSTRYKYHCTKYTSVLRRLAGAPDKEKMGKAKKNRNGVNGANGAIRSGTGSGRMGGVSAR